MTEYQEYRHRKAKLYVEHFDDIMAVEEAFDEEFKVFADTWGTQLADRLQTAEIVELPTLPSNHVAVDVEVIGGDTQRWIFGQDHSNYGGITRAEWWRHPDDFSTVDTRAAGVNDIRVTFFHLMQDNKQRALGDRTLELQLWHGRKNDDSFMEAMTTEIEAQLDSAGNEISQPVRLDGGKRRILTTTYDIPVTEQDDFLEAYLSALQTAFTDLVIERPELLNIITRAFEESLDRYT